MISIKVPCRICFFGDHQDYLGLPVIAGTIDRCIALSAEPIAAKAFQIHLKDIGEQISISLDDALDKVSNGDYFRSGMAVLKQKGLGFEQGFKITVTGNIPINAGVSSSSALTVTWIRFLVAAQQGNIALTDAEIGHMAYMAEAEYFNQPGGIMDQYTIAQQGLLHIDTKTRVVERLPGKIGSMVLAVSGIAKKTLDVLQNARSYAQNAIDEVKKHHPDFDVVQSKVSDYEKYVDLVPEKYRDHWYATIHNHELTKKAKQLLLDDTGDYAQLGKLMDAHQVILNDRIKNTPNEMANMMAAARNAGALGTKIIGSGGGGCMVALVADEKKEAVIEAFLDSGAIKAFEVELTYPNL